MSSYEYKVKIGPHTCFNWIAICKLTNCYDIALSKSFSYISIHGGQFRYLIFCVSFICINFKLTPCHFLQKILNGF